MARRYVRVSGQRYLVVQHDGVDGVVLRSVSHCSGCCELGDYGEFAHLYDYDAKAKCRVGDGCTECGWTGKRRGAMWASLDDVGHSPAEKESER